MTMTRTRRAVRNSFFLPLIGSVLAIMVWGCKSRVEEGYIFANDGVSRTLVSDCFVKISTAPGQLPGQFNNKNVALLFRDAAHKPFFKKEIALRATQIKPSVDWRDFPKVRVSLQYSGQEHVYVVTISGE